MDHKELAIIEALLIQEESQQHAKMVYENDKIQKNNRIETENIYMALLYMYARLRLGVYGPYIYIY